MGEQMMLALNKDVLFWSYLRSGIVELQFCAARFVGSLVRGLRALSELGALRHADIRTTMNLYTADVPQEMRKAHDSVAAIVLSETS
jgi:hypothetical protein